MEAKFATLMTDFKRKCTRIKGQLGSVTSEEKKATAREEIVSFYKEIAGYIRELLILQRSIRSLAEDFRTLKLPAEVTEDEKLMTFIQQIRSPQVDVLTLVDKGWNYICVGDYDGAVSILTQAAKLAPNDTRALGLLGWAYMYKASYDEALAIYQKVLSLEPENCLARNNLGYICYKKGIFGEAIEHLSEVLRLDKDRTATLYAHYYFGLIYLDREMLGDAISFLKKAIELGPNLIEAYYHLGVAYAKKGEEEEATRVWKEAAERIPDNQWARKCREELEARA